MNNNEISIIKSFFKVQMLLNNFVVNSWFDTSVATVHLPSYAPDLLFQFLSNIDTYYSLTKPDSYLLLGRELIKESNDKAMHGFASLNMPLPLYLLNCKPHQVTSQLLIAQYLVDEIVKLRPSYRFLEAIKLGNVDLPEQEKKAILQSIDHYMSQPKVFLQRLEKFSRKKLVYPCLGKEALDGGLYVMDYTEVRLITSAQFVLYEDEQGVRLAFSLKNNPVYQKFYAKGQAHASENGSYLKKELEHLAQYLDLQFADDSDFDEEIVFTPACTASLFSRGIVIKNQLPVNVVPKKIVSNNPLSFFVPAENKAACDEVEEQENNEMSPDGALGDNILQQASF
ncbi:MAG: hypothetical protein WC785_07005 [Tatlockia sp.]|jgi:hypothetical protein